MTSLFIPFSFLEYSSFPVDSVLNFGPGNTCIVVCSSQYSNNFKNAGANIFVFSCILFTCTVLLVSNMLFCFLQPCREWHLRVPSLMLSTTILKCRSCCKCFGVFFLTLCFIICDVLASLTSVCYQEHW